MNRNWYLISTSDEVDMFQEWLRYFSERVVLYVACLHLGRSLKITEQAITERLTKPETTVVIQSPDTIRFYRYPFIGEPVKNIEFFGWVNVKDDVD